AESAPQDTTAAEPAGEIAAEPVAEPAGEVAPEPVAEPAGQAAAEEGGDGLFDDSYTMLTAGGGAALIIALLLVRLARTKRARRTEESDLAESAESGPDGASDDGIEITFSETEIPTASETAPQPDGNTPLALDEEAEQTLSAEQTFDVGADTPSGHIDLDFGSLETAQNGIVSGALTQDEETQKRADTDWNTVESTDSVYEPETPNPYNPVSIVTDTPEPDFAEGKPETAGADSDNIPACHEEATPAQFFSGTQAPSGLAGFLKGSSPEIILEKTVGEVQTPEELHDFLKTYETDTVSDNAPETPDFHTAADDLSALMQPFEAPAVEENAAETVAETPDFHTAADDLSALIQPFEAPAVEENAAEITLETPDSNAPEADALPDFLKDGEKETIDWSISLAEENIPSNAGAGFASEAAGSDTPAQAKYDLAEMYLEIGDRDAAAETVKELLEEAEGDVLKRAQTLAQELGI
ncbi:FimV/HubP family polar landmark protein, partial [Neisseria lactamica]|uniref:FimV/HubP family polar landmark protein n=1 Tax=Neisseria lactamica TaxID=486 RepID=UPI00037C71B2